MGAPPASSFVFSMCCVHRTASSCPVHLPKKTSRWSKCPLQELEPNAAILRIGSTPLLRAPAFTAELSGPSWTDYCAPAKKTQGGLLCACSPSKCPLGIRHQTRPSALAPHFSFGHQRLPPNSPQRCRLTLCTCHKTSRCLRTFDISSSPEHRQSTTLCARQETPPLRLG